MPETTVPFVRAVLFVHGSGGSGRRWRRQVFSAERSAPSPSCASITFPPEVQLIALDLPGHAGSAGDGFQTIEEYAEFIEEFTAALNLSQVVLVGNSLGGAIALQVACSHPAWLNGIVLVGTGAKLRVSPDILNLGADQMPTALLNCSYSFDTDRDLIVEGEDDLSETLHHVRLGDLMACDIFDIRAQLEQITLPTLIVVGQEDRLTPVKYSEYLQDKIVGSQLVTIPAAGHMVMLEKPNEFNSILAEFIHSVL